eukprot:13989371-Alexandrium_andersonii.AAC.1
MLAPTDVDARLSGARFLERAVVGVRGGGCAAGAAASPAAGRRASGFRASGFRESPVLSQAAASVLDRVRGRSQ